jgi:hypothetical protein
MPSLLGSFVEKIQAIPNIQSAMTLIPISDLLEKWKDKGAGITIESLDDARVHGTSWRGYCQ